jgi:hypothetical protein
MRAGSFIGCPILRARIFAIACGYEDADDLDPLRTDTASKLACGRLSDTEICARSPQSRARRTPKASSRPEDSGGSSDTHSGRVSAAGGSRDAQSTLVRHANLVSK